MTNLRLKALLRKLGACQEARVFVQKQSLAEAWSSCQRADWMLWLCGKMADKQGWPSRKQVVLAACACAETSLKFVKKGEKRPARAIETARKWTRGKATIEEVRMAAYATYAAAAAAATYAAAAAAATYAARAKALADMADIVRSILNVPTEDI